MTEDHQEEMLLDNALLVLATTHTKDDDLIGFTVESTPSLHFGARYSHDDYVQAWRVVRRYLHLKTEPDIKSATQLAMSLAPDQVRHWLDERPDPDSVSNRAIPTLELRA